MITKEEYLELKELYNNGYRWIARDSCEIIYAYKLEPIKLDFNWKYSKNNMITTCGDDFLLPYVYVKWEDDKPTLIADLINDYESHQVITGEKVNKTELIKWNYVASRRLTEDELEIYGHEYTWDGITPEEDETVFVSDGKTVWVDTWIYYSTYSSGFDNISTIEEFYWAPIPIPKPSIGEVE